MSAADPHYLIGAIAMNVELADVGDQTIQQAFTRIRELLVISNRFQPIPPATKVGDVLRNISASPGDPSPAPAESLA